MPRELITFEVGRQVFGFDIMAIREIRAWSPVTRLPCVPQYVAGVVNLRGTVLPVIDLAARLGWRAAAPGPRHAIIVTQWATQIGGWIVDAVCDIVTVPDGALQPPPSAPLPGGGDDTVVPFLNGLIALGDRMVMVLDLGALTGSAVRDAAASAAIHNAAPRQAA